MGTVEDRIRALGNRDSLFRELGVDRVTVAVSGVTILALVARLFALGDRVAHWDEARVAYWILEFAATGNYEYRPIIHGPFYHHVNRLLFDLLGAGDGTMRLAAAVVGGLVPLAALALRHRLRAVETVALALFLAANPILLYYSRFMRGDPIVAFGMFGAFALFVRAIDTGSRGSFFAGVALLSVAFTAKENALLYVVTWVGATALLLDHRLFRARDRDHEWTAVLGSYARRGWNGALAWLPSLLVGAVEFLAVIVFFYAPRAASEDGPGLRKAVGEPAMIPAVIREATIGTWSEFYSLWVSGGHQDHAYLPYLADFLVTLRYGALALCLFAVVGFLVDRYAEEGPRDLVSFAFYWGFVSVLGYPIITDIKAPWATMHAIVPLAVPAAVGVGLIYRWGREGLAADDWISVGMAVLLLLVAAGQVGGMAVHTSYLEPQADGNDVVQYAQPADDIDPAVRQMAAAAADERAGADVLLYGEFFVDGDATATREPACAKWFNALPLPWYFSLHDVEVTCAKGQSQLSSMAAGGEIPPVVIVRSSQESVVSAQVDYESTTYKLRRYGTETTVFVAPEYADAGDAARQGSAGDGNARVSR
ncbi:TIGR03663 family protein [Halobacteriales archaeon QS_1_68_17]|nr:MAG: TIGR03663 family protein [Halobacteriales archaeon QS_1_68_17]